MIEKERASMGFGAEADNFDPDAWGARPAPAKPNLAAVRRVAEAQGFVSREAPPVPGRPKGRNFQLNIRVAEGPADDFYRIARANNLTLGQAFEEAVVLLMQKYEA